MVSHPPALCRSKIEKLEMIEYYGRNKGEHSGQVPHCNFYFVALIVFLV